MRELFFAFLENPTPENFGAVRSEVVNDPKYDGYSRDLDQMDRAINEKRFTDVGPLFAAAQPNLLLSPGAHLLLSVAAREQGNAKVADAERFICFRCLDGITGSGDGTQQKPYLVLRTSDEYDVLAALGKQLQTQHLVHSEDGRSCDRMVCADGSELWFDITAPFGTLSRRQEG